MKGEEQKYPGRGKEGGKEKEREEVREREEKKPQGLKS